MNDAVATKPGTPSRRRLLLGAAAAAAAAGVGVGWWRMRIGDAGAGAVDALWTQSFATPSGGELAMASLRGHTVLVNFWATWCPPCVEEMPMLDAFAQQQSAKGWQVVGLAIDQPSSVRQFLARTPVRYPIGLAGLQGTDLVRTLGNTSGGLPFTVLLGPDGTLRQRRIGKLSRADLDAWTAG
ncbi:TlpA family protein disulfide reductase [Ramlibacter sp. MMS24-I3-19]|uniref:TlpA family protein disulfide reductase n=1 Tax=Ramlibacter sp. MMS24-I3-19 TaxID=3416606 RepID=UPI003D053D1B